AEQLGGRGRLKQNGAVVGFAHWSLAELGNVFAQRFHFARQHVFGWKTVRVESLDKLRISHPRSIRSQATAGYPNVSDIFGRAQLGAFRSDDIVDGLRSVHLHS